MISFIEAIINGMLSLKLSLIGTNLTNVYHPDALTRTIFPAPGRTFKLAMEYKF